MSRSSYSDECEHLDLFRGNVYRSMRGYFGQARLIELRDALLALPVKALEEDIFVEGTREAPRVCALGAWALHKAGGDPEAAAAMVKDPYADEYTAESLKEHGWPRLVVLETIYANDVSGRPETSEERYARVLAWVTDEIVEARP